MKTDDINRHARWRAIDLLLAEGHTANDIAVWVAACLGISVRAARQMVEPRQRRHRPTGAIPALPLTPPAPRGDRP